jgi:hypothetical protein
VDTGIRSDGVSSTGAVLDVHLGLRWRAWRDLDVIGGFRSTRYENVGVELRPQVLMEVVTEADRSVTYEGFYGGVAYTF